MKKKNLLFLAAGGALFALTSCSSDDAIATNQSVEEANAISFRTLVDGTTRSTKGPLNGGANFAEGDVINVYAGFTPSGESEAKYFKDNFTKQAGVTGFTSTAKYYWPTFNSGDKMTFTAIYPGDDLSSIITATAGNIDNYSPNGTAANQIDVLVAKKEVTDKEIPVILNFRHALSQIVVNVKNTNAALDFDITGVRIGYVSTTGDFTYTGGVTTNQQPTGQTTASYTLVSASDWNDLSTPSPSTKYDQSWSVQAVTAEQTTAVPLSPSFKSWLLIPQTRTKATAYVAATQGTSASDPTLNGSYIALELEIYNYNGTVRSNKLVSKQWCYWPCDFTWVPGFKYTYTVDLAGGGYQPINTKADDTALDPVLGDVIVFSPACTVDYWVTPADYNVTMP